MNKVLAMVLIVKVDGGPDEKPCYTNTVNSVNLARSTGLRKGWLIKAMSILPHGHFGTHLDANRKTVAEN